MSSYIELLFLQKNLSISTLVYRLFYMFKQIIVANILMKKLYYQWT